MSGEAARLPVGEPCRMAIALLMALLAIPGAALIDVGVLLGAVLARKPWVSLQPGSGTTPPWGHRDSAWVAQPVGGKRRCPKR